MAKARKKDKPVYAFRWDGLALRPDMDFDRQALAGFKQGDLVHIEVTHWRSRPRLRAYWVYLNGVIKATECANHVSALHKYLKKEMGIVDYVRMIDGAVAEVEGSIALEEMPEEEMIAYFDAVVKLVAEKLGYVAPERGVA
jgi:hypothetical protein